MEAAIPYDDAIPQNAEGDEIVTASLTPAVASDRIHIVVTVAVSAACAITALFRI